MHLFCKQHYLDGFRPFTQHLAMHFLHGQAGLRRLGEFHIADTFGLLCLLVFDNPNPLDVPKYSEALAKLVFCYGPTCDGEKPTIGRVVEVFAYLLSGILLHRCLMLESSRWRRLTLGEKQETCAALRYSSELSISARPYGKHSNIEI